MLYTAVTIQTLATQRAAAGTGRCRSLTLALVPNLHSHPVRSTNVSVDLGKCMQSISQSVCCIDIYNLFPGNRNAYECVL